MTWQKRVRRGLPIWLSLVFLSFLVSAILESFEPDYGLPLLYRIRGEVSPPDSAVIVGLDRAGVDWLAFHADRLSVNAPGIATCLPPLTQQELAKASNVEDLPRGLIACVVEEILKFEPAAVMLDIYFAEATDEVNDGKLEGVLQKNSNIGILEYLSIDTENSTIVRQKPAQRFSENARSGFFVVEWRSGDTYRYLDRISDFPDLQSMPRVAADIAGIQIPGSVGDGTYFRSLWLFGPAGTVPTISFLDLLTGKFHEKVSDKVVFVGASNPFGAARRDDFETGWSSSQGGDLTGVELAATAFLNLTEGQRLRRLSIFWEIPLAALAGLVLLIAGFVFNGFRGSAAVIACAGVYLATAAAAFSSIGQWLPVTAVLFVFTPLAILLSLGRSYLDTSAVLFRFLPASIASALVRSHTRSRTPARPVEGTVMVIDLVGSTPIAEALGEVEFERRMTAFFNVLHTAIDAEQGMILKYTGDGALAVFNAGVASNDHASHALAAAAAIGRRLREDAQEDIVFAVRIGVNSGSFVLGEIGADSRSSIDALGNTVNIAARLEELAKKHHGTKSATILASEHTIGSALSWRKWSKSIGLQTIRGQENALLVYEVDWEAEAEF